MIYGITGPAGAGKDTAGAYICKVTGATHISFAAPLKAGLAAMGFPEPSNRDDKEVQIPGFPFSWRRLAQTLGTEWRNMVDPDLWLKLAMNRATGSGDCVFTDVRFDAEATAIRERGGKIIHIQGRKVGLNGLESHASEQGILMLDTDFFVDNSGTLEQLHSQLESIIHV